MRALTYLAAALAILPGALAVGQKKSMIVWFEDESTPDSVVNEAAKVMTDNGAKITHRYTIIKGFSVIAPEKALQSIQTWDTDHAFRIEEDETVSSQ